MFLNRHAELDFLNSLVDRRQPGPGQFVLLYGRRRVGKTALLQTWAERSGLPFIYWAADREPAGLQRRSLLARVLDLPEGEGGLSLRRLAGALALAGAAAGRTPGASDSHTR